MPKPEWRLYAVVREDLRMPPGKLASQTGHAFLESFLVAGAHRQEAFRSHGLGTKICLLAKGLESLLRLEAKLQYLGLPHARITDVGRNTTFGGVPTISALGVGPLNQEEAAVLKRFELYP